MKLQVEPEIVRRTFTITLNEDEAEALTIVLRRVGGSTSLTKRKHLKDLERELSERFTDLHLNTEKYSEGSICFKSV